MAEATASAPAPVMDVVAPPAEKKTENPHESETDPLDQLAADDQKAQATLAQAQAKQTRHPAAKKQPVKPAETAARSGVSLAITVTVIIVLGLAALATYAYLQTNK